ncbi:MAG TPA: amino acid permease, partial [Alphaproteobacteria bacterium]|nr:amino acid permease [Alphaproteobacteria bacterium]
MEQRYDHQHGQDLNRALGPFGLTALGIGAIIGAGIFVITGAAAAKFAGPGIVFSFMIAGVGCLFAALCYAELAAMIPQSGSAYTYAYATMGQFFAWMIGWDLILEYLGAASAVAVGWSGYFSAFMKDIGWEIPAQFANAPLAAKGFELSWTGAILNVPAVALIVLLTTLLIVGIRASAGVNNIMVFVKVGIIVMIILFGLPLINPDNLTPFVPENTGEWGEFGWSGVLRASGVIFFAYIGFDAVSVAAREAKNPQRDMPVGILGSLFICTALYILMSLTLVGLTDYTTLNVPNPASFAIQQAGPSLSWLVPLVNIAAIVGLATVVLVSLYGQTRIFFAMADDGFLPQAFAKVHPTFRTPYRGTLLTGFFAALLAGLFPLDLLGELVSIGTLLAFVVVCVAVLVLRQTHPKANRPFRTPWVPFVP